MGLDGGAKPMSGSGRGGAASRKTMKEGMVRHWRRSSRSSKWRSKRRCIRSDDGGAINANEHSGASGIGKGQLRWRSEWCAVRVNPNCPVA
jgi:hypothetical protein